MNEDIPSVASMERLVERDDRPHLRITSMTAEQIEDLQHARERAERIRSDYGHQVDRLHDSFVDAMKVDRERAMQDIPNRDLAQFLLRLPVGLREDLKAAAAANNRSLNSEILARLQDSMELPRVVAATEDVLNRIAGSRVTLEAQALTLAELAETYLARAEEEEARSAALQERLDRLTRS